MMSERTFSRVFIMGCYVLLSASLGSAQAAPTISLGTLVPEGTSYHRSIQEMGAAWRKAAGGGARLRIYAGEKLGGEAKMVGQMRLGALDAGLLTAVGLSEIEPAVTGLQSMPMMFRSLAEVDYVGQQLQPALEKRMAAKGFKVLFWTDAGWIRFFSVKPVETPDDLRKTKLWVWAGDPTTVEIWKQAGFNPVPLETGNILPMLETQLINAVPMPPFAALSYQIYERTPHMLELNWAPLVGALVIRSPSWEKIPAAAREEMLLAARKAGEENKEQGRKESERAVGAMKSKGLTVHAVTPELEAQWRTAAEQFYPRIKGKLVPADIFDQVQKHLTTYRSQNQPAAR